MTMGKSLVLLIAFNAIEVLTLEVMFGSITDSYIGRLLLVSWSI